jgi:heat shock protein HslJ
MTTMRTIAAALFALMLTACVQTSGSAPDAPASYLTGTSWRRVDDVNANPHGATMAFTADRASGYTGCNNWFASVTHDGEALRFGAVGMTRRACDGAGVQIDTERSFLAVIETTRYAHYDQDALVLLDENQQVIAEFNVE